MVTAVTAVTQAFVPLRNVVALAVPEEPKRAKGTVPEAKLEALSAVIPLPGPVMVPVTPSVPPTVAAPLIVAVTVEMLPVLAFVARFFTEASPATLSAPVTSAVVRTDKLLSVATPEVVRLFNAVMLVTLSEFKAAAPDVFRAPRLLVPPTVRLLVTEALFSVANADVVSVVSVVAPTTPSVVDKVTAPSTESGPLIKAEFVTVKEPRVAAPVTPRVPPTDALFVIDAEASVARLLVVSVAAVAFPTTVKLPATAESVELDVELDVLRPTTVREDSTRTGLGCPLITLPPNMNPSARHRV